MAFPSEFEKLTLLAIGHWARRRTLVLINIFIIVICVWKFTDTKLSDLSIFEICAISTLCISFSFIWWYTTKLPKAKRGRVGFAIAVDCDTKELEKTITTDFISNLRRILNTHGLEKKFELVHIPQAHASRITETDDAIKVQTRARCHFMMHGTAKMRIINGKQTYVLNLDFQVTHRPIPKQLSEALAKEMSELFPRRLHLDKENDLFSLEFTSEWIDCVLQYTIGIAASLSGDLDYAEKLFLALWHNKQFKQANIPQFKKMRQRVPIRLGEIYSYHASQLFECWRESRTLDKLEQMWTCLTKLRNFYPDQYAGHLMAAIYFFVARDDINSAIRELKKCRSVRDATWEYSYAFLLAYRGELLKAKRMYMSAFHHHCERADVPLQVEEFILWILDEKPDKVQLHFCLGLINWKAKEDKHLALNHFNEFIKQCHGNQFTESQRLAKEYIKNIRDEINKETI